MRAVVVDKLGPDPQFDVREIDEPARLMNEVLVDVHSAGVNPIDAKTLAGGGAAAGIRALPWVPGNDFAGTVAQSPYEAHDLQPGDEVYGMASPARTWGSFAERVAVSSMQVARKPQTLSMTEAAAVPCAALTAWDAVVRVARVRSGQRILIHAGAGGVGHFAVQFAKYFGAHVVATASGDNVDFVRELGADTVIDYTAARFEDGLQKVDVVVDLVGNVADNTGSRSLDTLKSGGLYLNIPTGSWPEYSNVATARALRSSSVKVEPSGDNLAIISRLIDDGAVRVHVGAAFPLDEAAAALAAQATGHGRGKIVLDVR